MADSIANDKREKYHSGKSRWRSRARLVLGALAVGVLCYVGRDHFGKLEELRSARLSLVAAMVGLFLALRFLTSLILKISLSVLGYSIGTLEAFCLTLLRGYAGLVIPRAGFGAAGVYLKMRHRVSFAKFGAMALPVLIINLCMVGVMGLATLGIICWLDKDAIRWDIFAVFAMVLAIGGAGLAFRLRLPAHWSGRIVRALRQVDESWLVMRRAPTLMRNIVVLQFAMALLRAGRLYLALYALGYTPWIWGTLVASLLADLMFIVGLTPNALGLREAAIVYGATLMGVATDEALAAAVLDRVVTTLTTIIVAQLAIWYLAVPADKYKQSSDLPSE